MSSSSLPPPPSSVISLARQIELDPDPFGTEPNQSTSDRHFYFIAGGVVGGVVALFAACTVWRIRLVRRRRAALGLPPVSPRVRRLNLEDEDSVDHKPTFHDAWMEIGSVTDGERLRWDQIRALSSTRVSSLLAPPKAEEMGSPFEGYFSSILELVSIDRLDKALLKTAQKDRLPDYQKSEIITSVIIVMPQPRRHSVAETRRTCGLDLELGVHECPWPEDCLRGIDQDIGVNIDVITDDDRGFTLVYPDPGTIIPWLWGAEHR
ncbi:hypothetical protein M407DRAFT_214658 [Tulasnella calospora MUT 4182]|uniref:Uncharacterized protein n=1 Tax=Tulasnella calospora MUT 4182 TaxID=1051891 RepID=A0A0C3QEG9_9AGAM|nr:hypothetical protein M407DRAFT_214658 [Tulasnella calospora MUT 4182]